jgi:diguanylate cyclase (GGDEF)-like protein
MLAVVSGPGGSASALVQARHLVQALPDPSLLLDSALVPLDCNTAYALLAGLRPRQMQQLIERGTSPLDLLAFGPSRAAEIARTCIDTGKPIHLAEEQLTNTAGAVFTVHVTYIPVTDPAGATIGIIQSVRDVSAEARIQTRYRQLLDDERRRSEELEREVARRTHELTAALAEVTRISRTDPLTGLLNRRAFTELAEQQLVAARDHGRTVGVLLADLDHFKRVNDQFGHQTGDRLLVAIGGALRESVRGSDVVARFGGEEFVILLDGADREVCSAVARRVHGTLARLNLSAPGRALPQPTISIGVALFPGHGQTLDELLSRADQALYLAKEGGRNRTVVHDPDRTGAHTGAPTRRRVLLCAADPAPVRTCLEPRFELWHGATPEAALALCQDTRFDAIVADHGNLDLAIEFLRRSLQHQPDCIRGLILPRHALLADGRGSALARVDFAVLHDELATQLDAALIDALARHSHHPRQFLDRVRTCEVLAGQRAELEELLAGGALRFAFQPIVDPRTHETHAFEALCRAATPRFRDPARLFDSALHLGLLNRLGRLTRRLAVAHLVQLPAPIKLFLNLHPAEVDDPELLRLASRADASRVVFEITEQGAIVDHESFGAQLVRLAAHGYRIAIDDLGAGYARLHTLTLPTPEYIKIDMSIVRGVDRAPRRTRLLRRMVEFADDIGVQLIAEGVETEAEAEAVATLGCHLAQGYYFGRPQFTPEFPARRDTGRATQLPQATVSMSDSPAGPPLIKP